MKLCFAIILATLNKQEVRVRSCIKILCCLFGFFAVQLKAQIPFYPDTVGLRVYHISIGGESSEFAPVIFNNRLYFVSDRDYRFGIVNFREGGKQFYDIYAAEKKDSTHFGKPVNLKHPINTLLNDGPISVTSSGMYITGNSRTFKSGRKSKLPLQISYARIGKDNAASDPARIDFGLPDSISFGQAHVSGDTLMFLVSDKQGGYGGTDIYESRKVKGKWQPPVNSGPQINSPSNEEFPYFKNGSLYFSSDKSGGIGKLDLYLSEKKGKEFTGPRLLAAPLNSIEDDFAIFMNDDGHSGYFSSNRDKSDDVFYFSFDTVPHFTNCEEVKFNEYCYTFYERSAQEDKDTANTYYQWTFGDGKKSRGPEVYHCFEGAGKYIIELNVVDKSTGEPFFNQLSYEMDLNNIEQVYIDMPDTVRAGQEADFNYSHSNVPGFTIIKSAWDFGDGKYAFGARPVHLYTIPGQYIIKLGVQGELNGKHEKKCVTRTLVVLPASSPLQPSKTRRIPKYRSDEHPAVAQIIDSILLADPKLFIFLKARTEKLRDKNDSIGFIKPVPESLLNDTAAIFSYNDPNDTSINYRVHIGSSEVPLKLDDPVFKGLDSISEIKTSRLYQYFYGKFQSPKVALKAVQKVKDMGFSPFVFPFERDSMSYSISPEMNKKLFRDTLKTPTDSFTVVVFFKYDDYTVSRSDHRAIESLVDRFCKFGCEFILSGYSDSKGSNEYNIKLGKKRVNAVSDVLKSKGISPKKIHVRHVGIFNKELNESDELRRQERRVEIMLITK